MDKIIESKYKLAEKALELTSSLISSYNSQRSTALGQPLKVVLTKGLIMVLIAKSRKSSGAFLLLAKNGYKEDVQSILRSIFENILNVNFILSNENPVEWAERYVDYEIVSSNRYADKYLKHGKDAAQKMIMEDRKDALAASLTELGKKYGKNFAKSLSWSGKTIKEMADICDMVFYYDILYSVWSDFSHGNIQSTRGYTEIVNGEMGIMEGPNFNIGPELAAFVNFMIIIGDTINRQFDLKRDKDIEALKAENEAEFSKA